MMRTPIPRSLAFALIGLLGLTAVSVQAEQNPFSLERTGSRLPVIAQNDGADDETSGKKEAVMQCGAGMCGGSMGASKKPAEMPETQNGKCGGMTQDSGKPSGASQCGGGMGASEKPVAMPKTQSDKCAGTSPESAKPASASRCGGGK